MCDPVEGGIGYVPCASCDPDEFVEVINRLLFRYDNDPNFGVREFATALNSREV